MLLISVILVSCVVFAKAQRNDNAVWITVDDVRFNRGDNRPYLPPVTVDDNEACQALCGPGCDYTVFKNEDINDVAEGLFGDAPVNSCFLVSADKTDFTQTFFTNQEITRPLYGEILQFMFGGAGYITTEDTTAADCLAACNAAEEPCYFITFHSDTEKCTYTAGFWDSQGFISSYRQNPDLINSNPTVLGRFDDIGNTGIVCTHATLMPNSNSIACQNRPEYYRGGINGDNILEGSTVINGEIGSIFDVTSGESQPSHINENIFCHGVTVTRNGNLFSAGGDDGEEQGGVDEFRVNWEDAATGLDIGAGPDYNTGITTLHEYNLATNTWTLLQTPIQSRWYPTVLRTADDCFIIAGGQGTAQGDVYAQSSLETYCQGDEETTGGEDPIDLEVMTEFVLNSPNYPHMAMIPNTGNVFMLVVNLWVILNPQGIAAVPVFNEDGFRDLNDILLNDPEMNRFNLPIGDPDYPTNKVISERLGMRGNTLPAAGAIMPITTNIDGVATECRFAIFGGGQGGDFLPDENDFFVFTPATGDISINTVLSMDLLAGDFTNADTWVWDDEDNMPHGRLTANAVIQPNGLICLFGGWQRGITGGNMGGDIPAGQTTVTVRGDELFYENIGGVPGKGSVMDTWCYDRSQPTGERWTVMAFNRYRRHYHSSAILTPDGKTVLLGTDQATYETYEQSPYQHKAEAWTAPWFLDGTPRPIIDSYPRQIQFGTTFSVVYSGAQVDTACLMAPGSNTHGTEMNQRMMWLYVVDNTDDTLTLVAPADSTVMLGGDHMLFLNNDKTPSEAVWVELTNDEVATPTFRPTEIPTEIPTETPTGIPTETPTEIPTVTPTETPTEIPTEIPTVTPTEIPTEIPTVPTEIPTEIPTVTPTDVPTEIPTTSIPTVTTTYVPTEIPTTSMPTEIPTMIPTVVSSDVTTSSDGVSVGAVVGGVIGGVIFLLAVILLALFAMGYFNKREPGYEVTSSSQDPMVPVDDAAGNAELTREPTLVFDGVYDTNSEGNVSARAVTVHEDGVAQV